jgi:hypothetical protein
MGRCYHTRVVDAQIERVWATIRDFHDLSWAGEGVGAVERAGDVKGDQVGARRVIEGVIHETLTALDDAAHTFEYRIDEGPGPLARGAARSYVGRVRLLPVTTSGGTLVEWSSEFEAADEAAVKAMLDPVYRELLAALARRLAGERAPDPGHILQVGFAFWGSKALLSAAELGLFTALGQDGLTAAELRERLGLAPRAVPDLPDALVALGLLDRDGEGAAARYRNTRDGALFLDRTSPAYVGGILEMANARLYPFWADLTEALRTGRPQNEIKRTGAPMFEELYREPARLEQFMRAMAGVSAGPIRALAERYDFSKYRTLADVGGATGLLAITVAGRHPHLACKTCDLPVVAPIARRSIAAAGLEGRVEAVELDFLRQPLPTADVISMGMILHDWDLPGKKHLIRAAYEALPPGGAFVVMEHFIDDARRENAFGLLMSLNMLVEFGDAFDFTFADLEGWCREVGFARFERLPLAGPSSALIAYRPMVE